MHELSKQIFYKSLVAAFIVLLSEAAMPLNNGGWGNCHPQTYSSKIQEIWNM